jgi:hypothetical protein
LERSSWIAARTLPSSHTNPVFAIVDGKPIRASSRSADWCLAAVNQYWTQKSPRIKATELDAARAGYDHARQVYASDWPRHAKRVLAARCPPQQHSRVKEVESQSSRRRRATQSENLVAAVGGVLVARRRSRRPDGERPA